MNENLESNRAWPGSSFAIMQGRLTPPRGGEQQYFPLDTWESEFAVAGQIGFAGIEWLVDSASLQFNPLLDAEGKRSIQKVQSDSGTSVPSVCADVFKENTIDSASFGDASFLDLLELIISGARDIGAGVVVVPLIENSSVQNLELKSLAVPVLKTAGEIADRNQVMIAIEADLAHRQFADLLDEIDHDAVGACIDLGNLSASGLNPQRELLGLGEHVRHVHIKDRALGGGNVPLGSGDVDFKACLDALYQIGFEGTMTFETTRGDSPDEDARGNIRYMNQLSPEPR